LYKPDAGQSTPSRHIGHQTCRRLTRRWTYAANRDHAPVVFREWAKALDGLGRRRRRGETRRRRQGGSAASRAARPGVYADVNQVGDMDACSDDQ
jgi:hypothetical protein